ncbi:MAG: aminotransferase class IV [Acidobacteriota bacterium]|nr:aminotransferase class IV [Acidobacteriota bacterium]
MAIVWLNGRYLDERRARLPVTDPVFRWGVGLFEVVRGYHGRPFRLEDHLSRLRRSADRLSIDTRRLPGLSRVIPRLLARNELRSGRVRISVTGAGNVLIEARRHAPPDGRIGERGAKLVVAPWRRDPAAPLAGHKTLNYHELVLARDAAARLGAVDALILDPGGRVLEGTRSNVFAVLGGGLLTPDVPRGVLPGVTRGRPGAGAGSPDPHQARPADARTAAWRGRGVRDQHDDGGGPGRPDRPAEHRPAGARDPSAQRGVSPLRRA